MDEREFIGTYTSGVLSEVRQLCSAGNLEQLEYAARLVDSVHNAAEWLAGIGLRTGDPMDELIAYAVYCSTVHRLDESLRAAGHHKRQAQLHALAATTC